jgi:hypothetical protein
VDGLAEKSWFAIFSAIDSIAHFIVDKKKMKVLSQRHKPWRYQMEKSVKISESTMIVATPPRGQ